MKSNRGASTTILPFNKKDNSILLFIFFSLSKLKNSILLTKVVRGNSKKEKIVNDGKVNQNPIIRNEIKI